MRRVRGRTRDERGVVAIVSAAVAITLLVVSAFVVDLGMTWERRGKLQSQADKAAIFAAQSLPATDDAGRKRVAKRVAYYLACNTVSGQRVLNVALPGCPASTTSPELDTYAEVLLTSGLVSFPSSTQVQVITPTSEVKFAFAGAVGVEDTTQAKSAIAKVSSPGELLPIGLSLQCLAAVVNEAGIDPLASRVLPLSYVTTGATSTSTPVGEDYSEQTLTSWPTEYTTDTTDAVTITSSSVSQATGVLTFTVTRSPWVTVDLSSLLGNARMVFAQRAVDGSTSVVGPVIGTGLSALGGGSFSVALPDGVKAAPGLWHFKLEVDTGFLGLFGADRWTTNDGQFAYVPSDDVAINLQQQLSNLLDLPDTLACGRVLDSPRPRDGGAPALVRNLQEGLDHALVSNPALAELSPPLAPAELLNALGDPLELPDALTDCGTAPSSRRDTVDTFLLAEAGTGAPANCARISTSVTAEDEFTAGLLMDTGGSLVEPGYGRLSCFRDGACDSDASPVSIPGFDGTYNNDAFSDFVTGGDTILDSSLAYSLDTFLLSDLPLVTPHNRLDPDLYGSPRFGWVPVLSHVDLNADTSRDFPILTFRPVFLDNGDASELAALGINVSDISDPLLRYLAERVADALEVVRSSVSLLQQAFNSVLAGLGLQDLAARLADPAYLPTSLDVEEILVELTDGLGMDMGKEHAGLLVQEGKLKAARFMTIAPGGLPPIPDDYDGPLMDYVGVGPKIVRLVK